MRNRIFLKLLAAFALVIAAATVTLDVSIRHAWEASLRQEIEQNLKQKTLMLANRVNGIREISPSSLQPPLQDVASEEAQASGARATIVDAQGKVLADSEPDSGTSENHAARPEFRSALQGEVGSDTRRSRTVGLPYLYVAAPIAGGAVRLAYPLSESGVILGPVRHNLLVSSLLGFLVALVISGLAAHLTARRLQNIVQFADRIATGDLTARIEKSPETKSGRWLLPSTKPPAILRKASPLCRPASVNSKPC